MYKRIKNINGVSINYSNLSKQIYKYFNLYRNNAINGLLFRDRKDKKRLDIENKFENNIPFTPNLQKSSTFSKNHFKTETRLSVEKNYDQYIKNKEFKIKQKEKELEKIEKEKCPFIPNCFNSKEKKNIIEISKRLHKTGLKHLKNCSSTPNNFNYEQCKRWYDGYKLENVELYNPLSVLESIRNKKIQRT